MARKEKEEAAGVTTEAEAAKVIEEAGARAGEVKIENSPEATAAAEANIKAASADTHQPGKKPKQHPDPKRDFITITRKDRIRQCERADFPTFKRQGYTKMVEEK